MKPTLFGALLAILIPAIAIGSTGAKKDADALYSADHTHLWMQQVGGNAVPGSAGGSSLGSTTLPWGPSFFGSSGSTNYWTNTESPANQLFWAPFTGGTQRAYFGGNYINTGGTNTANTYMIDAASNNAYQIFNSSLMTMGPYGQSPGSNNAFTLDTANSYAYLAPTYGFSVGTSLQVGFGNPPFTTGAALAVKGSSTTQDTTFIAGTSGQTSHLLSMATTLGTSGSPVLTVDTSGNLVSTGKITSTGLFTGINGDANMQWDGITGNPSFGLFTGGSTDRVDFGFNASGTPYPHAYIANENSNSNAYLIIDDGGFVRLGASGSTGRGDQIVVDSHDGQVNIENSPAGVGIGMSGTPGAMLEVNGGTQFDGNVLPNATNTLNIGSASQAFANIYGGNFFAQDTTSSTVTELYNQTSSSGYSGFTIRISGSDRFDAGMSTSIGDAFFQAYDEPAGGRASGMYIYPSGTYGDGIAFGSSSSAYSGNSFYVEPVNNVAYTASGVSLGVGTATPVQTLDVNGLIRMARQGSGSTPTCGSTQKNSLALTNAFILCVCNGSSWVKTADGSTACTF